MTWFESLSLYTMAREIASLDNAKLKLYVENVSVKNMCVIYENTNKRLV